jgi:hypothetical protein
VGSWRRCTTCCRCGAVAAARSPLRRPRSAPPFGAAGTVVYGPHVNAAAILLASEGNVPIERTARLMGGTAEGCRCRAGSWPGRWNAWPSA